MKHKITLKGFSFCLHFFFYHLIICLALLTCPEGKGCSASSGFWVHVHWWGHILNKIFFVILDETNPLCKVWRIYSWGRRYFLPKLLSLTWDFTVRICKNMIQNDQRFPGGVNLQKNFHSVLQYSKKHCTCHLWMSQCCKYKIFLPDRLIHFCKDITWLDAACAVTFGSNSNLKLSLVSLPKGVIFFSDSPNSPS